MELSLPYHTGNCVHLARHECALSPGHSYRPVTKLCHHAALQPKHITRMIHLRPATVLQHAPLLTPVPQVQRSAQGGHNPTHVSGGGQAQDRGTVELRSGMALWEQTGNFMHGTVGYAMEGMPHTSAWTTEAGAMLVNVMEIPLMKVTVPNLADAGNRPRYSVHLILHRRSLKLRPRDVSNRPA